MYIDGVQDASNFNYTPSGTFSVTNAYVGAVAHLGSTTDYTTGNILAVQTFTRALSATEVSNLYTAGLASTTMINLPLQEGTGTTAYDTSGNGNNGTITAGTYTADVPSQKRQLVGGNLVQNGAFEFAPPTGSNVACTSGASKWLDGTSTGSVSNYIFRWALIGTAGLVSALFDSSNAYTGAYGLKVSTTATSSNGYVTNYTANPGLAVAAIPILPSTQYTGTYWMKTVANSGAATSGANLAFTERNAAGALVNINNGTFVNTTTGWTQYTVTFTTGATSRYLTPKLSVVCNDGAASLIMDAWFDDITLIPTVNTSRTIA